MGISFFLCYTMTRLSWFDSSGLRDISFPQATQENACGLDIVSGTPEGLKNFGNSLKSKNAINAMLPHSQTRCLSCSNGGIFTWSWLVILLCPFCNLSFSGEGRGQ